MLAEEFPRLDYFELGEPSRATPTLTRIAELAARADQLLAAFVVKPAAWHRFGLPPRLRDWLQGLVAKRPTVIALPGCSAGPGSVGGSTRPDLHLQRRARFSGGFGRTVVKGLAKFPKRVGSLRIKPRRPCAAKIFPRGGRPTKLNQVGAEMSE